MMGVAFKRADVLAGFDVEGLHKLIRRPGDQKLPVAGELHAQNRVAVGVFDVLEQLAAGHVPDHQFARPRRLSAAGGEQFSIPAEIEGQHAVDERRSGKIERLSPPPAPRWRPASRGHSSARRSASCRPTRRATHHPHRMPTAGPARRDLSECPAVAHSRRTRVARSDRRPRSRTPGCRRKTRRFGEASPRRCSRRWLF